MVLARTPAFTPLAAVTTLPAATLTGMFGVKSMSRNALPVAIS